MKTPCIYFINDEHHEKDFVLNLRDLYDLKKGEIHWIDYSGTDLVSVVKDIIMDGDPLSRKEYCDLIFEEYLYQYNGKLYSLNNIRELYKNGVIKGDPWERCVVITIHYEDVCSWVGEICTNKFDKSFTSIDEVKSINLK